MEGHTACVFGSSLVIFGGKHNIYSNQQPRYSNKVRLVNDVSLLINRDYNLHQLQLMPATPLPFGRAYHTACIYRERYMVVIGGMIEEPNEQMNCMRSVNVLDLELGRWSHVIAKGDQPISRIHHASVVLNKDLYIHGGYPILLDNDGSSKEFSAHQLLSMDNVLFDTFVLSLESMIWRRVTSTASVRPLLWGHSGIFFRDNILLFGGLDVSKGKEVGELALWDIYTRSWQWANCNSPVASAMHKAVVVGMHSKKNQEPTHMLVFGGVQFSTQESVLELREFDLEKGQWKILPGKGEIPAGRIGHALVSYMSDWLILVGGVIRSSNGPVQDNGLYIYHLRTQKWKRVSLNEGERPFTKGEKRIHRKPFIGGDYKNINWNPEELQVGRSNQTEGLHPTIEKSNTQWLEKKTANRKSEKKVMHHSIHDEQNKVFYQENLGIGDSQSDSYDLPPPLPSAVYTLSRMYKQGPDNGLVFEGKNDKKTKKNMSNKEKTPRGLNPVEFVSNLSDEQIFDSLGRLMNVSFFGGEKNESLENPKTSSEINSSLCVSPPLLRKLINSALPREVSDKLPDHIKDSQLSEDPFTYLRPTKTVLRWRQGSSGP
ncbi:hypothetical protein TcYC6_0035210 [Trypanosoma cruzi]|nr:hypothetical protein TcYC6_0035210 [Trypanosoma cruzi]